MIHQLIFAAPRPGMTEAEFQRYWVDVHAVRYASKIPQFRKYLVDTRIPLPGDEGEPLWSGVGEIWLANEEDQLASLQSKEFLDGARLDEPRWAAFWRTVGLDTTAHEILPGPPLTRDMKRVKLMFCVKRREGLPLADFRKRSLEAHAELMLKVPGLRRYLQCHTRDALYGVGEALLDAVYQCWFDSTDALGAALESPEYQSALDDMQDLAEPRYIHRMAAVEHWIIGPETR
jgi:uncharacterized protein (TIGR02118 family)